MKMTDRFVSHKNTGHENTGPIVHPRENKTRIKLSTTVDLHVTVNDCEIVSFVGCYWQTLLTCLLYTPFLFFHCNFTSYRVIYTLFGKKETKVFSVISPTKLGQLWWNLVYSFLNKSAAMWCKHFLPHLNSVSTLPCETWNAHRARSAIALLDTETPDLYIPPQLRSPNSQNLNPVDNSVWKILQEGVQNTHNWSGAVDDAADGWLPQWRRDPGLFHSVLSRCFSSSRSVMRILYIFSCDISHTL